jgi:hypothetical protein
MIQYYRAVAYFFFDLPARFWDLHFPSSSKDFWILSFIGASAYARTPNIEASRFFRRYPKLIVWRYWRVLAVVVGGFSGIGIAVLLAAASPMTYADDFHEYPLDLTKGAAVNALYIFGGALVFFVLNAFTPSFQ